MMPLYFALYAMRAACFVLSSRVGFMIVSHSLTSLVLAKAVGFVGTGLAFALGAPLANTLGLAIVGLAFCSGGSLGVAPWVASRKVFACRGFAFFAKSSIDTDCVGRAGLIMGGFGAWARIGMSKGVALGFADVVNSVGGSDCRSAKDSGRLILIFSGVPCVSKRFKVKEYSVLILVISGGTKS